MIRRDGSVTPGHVEGESPPLSDEDGEPADKGLSWRAGLLPSFRGYRADYLKSDISAGLAVAAVGLPSAIAYPAIAGLPVETGIYASIGSVIGYALLGPSRRLIMGPDAATMAILAAVLATTLNQSPDLGPADRVLCAAMIALCVGGICFLASWLRLGNLANLLSRPILAGFFIGVAISIMIGQIGRVTGLKIEAEGFVSPLIEMLRKSDAIHWPSLALAAGMFVILQAARRWPLPIPAPVIVILFAGALSAVLNFEALGIKVVGDVPTGLPNLGLPLSASFSIDHLLVGAAAVFVVSFGAGIVTARSFAAQTGEEVDANAELRGFGAANLGSAFLGGFPVTSSDSRTAVNLSVGGKTQLAALVAAAALICSVVFFSGALRLLPVPALGAILISAAMSVIDLKGLEQIWRISRVEFGLAMIAMVGAVNFGVLQGVVVAIIATFIYVILNQMQPRVVLLGRMPGRAGFYKMHRSPGIRPIKGMTICFIQGSLLFFNADYVKSRLREIIAAMPGDTRWLVIDASAMTQIDSTATEMLEDINAELKERGVRLGLSDVQSDVAERLDNAGLVQAIDRSMIFEDIDDVVRAFDAEFPPSFISEGADQVEGTP